MGFNRLRENPWLSRILLIVSIASAAAVLLLYTRIDSLVNGSLYSYKLQFSSNWYNPYKSTTQLINICLGAVLTLNALTLGLTLFNKKTKIPENNSPIKQSISNVQGVKQPNFTFAEKTSENQSVTNINTCQSCNKTFTRPLVTLNFVNGKPKMMNTCPYCNAPIDNTNNDKTSDVSIQIADEEKENLGKSRD